MVCKTCQSCSLYSVIDICPGQQKFNDKECPIEKRLKHSAISERFIGLEDKDMRPWGEKKKKVS